METIFGFLVLALLFSIVIATSIVIWTIETVFKKKPTQLMKKIITTIVGCVLSLIWFYFVPDSRVDLIILTFFAAVGFYDIIIKTIEGYFSKKKDSNETESNSSI